MSDYFTRSMLFFRDVICAAFHSLKFPMTMTITVDIQSGRSTVEDGGDGFSSTNCRRHHPYFILATKLQKYVVAAYQDNHGRIIISDYNNGTPIAIMIGAAVLSSSTRTK